VIHIENLIDLWFNETEFFKLTGAKLEKTFTEIWNCFIKLLGPIDHIMQDRELISLPYQLISIFFNPDFFDMLMENFQQKGLEMSVLVVTIPGASCYSIGYRFSTILRFIFNLQYK